MRIERSFRQWVDEPTSDDEAVACDVDVEEYIAGKSGESPVDYADIDDSDDDSDESSDSDRLPW